MKLGPDLRLPSCNPRLVRLLRSSELLHCSARRARHLQKGPLVSKRCLQAPCDSSLAAPDCACSAGAHSRMISGRRAIAEA